MRKLIPYLAVLMAVSVAFLTACTQNNRKQTDAGRTQTQMKDSDAKKMIQARLKADPQLSAADLDVSADVKKNEVKLSGTVKSEDMRNKAVQIARDAVPGFTISDTIDVKPEAMARSTFDDRNGEQGQEGMEGQAGTNRGTSDDSIRSQIQSQLSSQLMNQQDVKVSVHNGVVTLTGKVDSENEKAQIQRTAQQVQGVKRIDNRLQVSGNQTQGRGSNSMQPSQQPSPAPAQ